jgi:dolichyl-phosphate-mannose-protein mannosyltransferase
MSLWLSHTATRFYTLTLIVMCAALVVSIRVSEPEFSYFDEIFYVASVHDIRSGLGIGESTHPPMVKVLMLWSIALFGDSPFAWRLPSVVSGIALVGLVFGIMRSIGSSGLMATVCALFVTLDGLCLTQARIGMLNAPCVALGCGSLLLALHRRTFLSGVLLGCSVASKFVGLAFVPVVLFALWRTASIKKEGTGRYLTILFLLTTAATMYLISFVPLLSFMSSLWSGILLYHTEMLQHHLHDASIVHRYGSPWWSWPFLLRPIWYGFEEVGGNGLVRGVLCIANPVVAAVVVFGVVAAMVRWFRTRAISFGEAVAVLGFLANLLPWAFSPRLTMFHYYYPAYVFGIILACLQLDRVSTRARWFFAIVLCAASIGMFVYWYPLWTALPIPRDRYESMIWFDTWR